jgi:hypothetical protein
MANKGDHKWYQSIGFIGNPLHFCRFFYIFSKDPGSINYKQKNIFSGLRTPQRGGLESRGRIFSLELCKRSHGLVKHSHSLYKSSQCLYGTLRAFTRTFTASLSISMSSIETVETLALSQLIYLLSRPLKAQTGPEIAQRSNRTLPGHPEVVPHLYSLAGPHLELPLKI